MKEIPSSTAGSSSPPACANSSRRSSRRRQVAIGVGLVGAALLGTPRWPAAAEATAVTAETEPAGADGIVESYVAESLVHNLALRQRRLAQRSALAALEEARRGLLPSLDVRARYSLADGGRAIEFPVGDLMNPVFATLDELLVASGRRARFEPLDNVAIPFLRSQEQESRLRLSQPVYDRRLIAGARARRASSEAVGFGLAALERDVERDVRVAYYRYCGALAVLEVLQATDELVQESLRVSRSRLERGALTADEVLRDEAELQAVEKRRREAERVREAGRDLLNFLMDRAADAQIDSSGCLLDRLAAEGPEDREALGKPAAGASAQERRAELQQLGAAARTAEAREALVRAEVRPSLGLAVDYGIQGERYRLDETFWQASLVVSWNVASFGRNRARRVQARLATERLELDRERVSRQVELEARDAVERQDVARFRILASAERLASAEEAFRITSRRYEAGALPLVALVDARRELTEARIERRLGAYELEIARAEMHRAIGLDRRRQAADERAAADRLTGGTR